VKQPRGTQRYQPAQREDEDRLTRAIIELASQYGHYGYRRTTTLLRRAGWHVGKDRVYRIWHREGPKVPQIEKPGGRVWLNDGACMQLRPDYSNHVLTYDFVSTKIYDGRSGRMLNRIDESTRQCLLNRTERRKWLAQTGAKTMYIEPGSPWENGYCESFNTKLRDKFLNGEMCETNHPE